jgi:site-specific DNA-cytosine methylase
MIGSFDLFTGIGGFLIALHDVTRPLLCCDIDPVAKSVTQRHVPRGTLWVDDVRDLPTLRSVKTLPPPDILCGGFPCTGFSQSGRRTGFEDPQSGLFYDLIRVVECYAPPLVFMENVPHVLKNLDQVHAEFHRLGYDLRWCTLPATIVGAPLLRKRWFCLAVSRTRACPRLPAPPLGDIHSWKGDFDDAKTCDHAKAKARASLLGNSVVPALARYAFFFLYGGLASAPEEHTELAFAAELPDFRPLGGARKVADMAFGYTRGDRAFVADRAFRQGMNRLAQDACPPKNIVLRPSNFATDKRKNETAHNQEVSQTPITKRYWTGPRYGCVHATNYLGGRSARDIGTQARFCDERHPKKPYVNPQFVEWLMGFPKDWTKFF